MSQYLVSIEYCHEAFLVFLVALRNSSHLGFYALENVVAAGCQSDGRLSVVVYYLVEGSCAL